MACSTHQLHNRPHSQILLQSVPAAALIDSGAVISAVSFKMFQTLPNQGHGPFDPDVPLVGAGNNPLIVEGKYFLDITLEPSSGQEHKVIGWPFVVIHHLESEVILGNDFLVEVGANINMASGEVYFGVCQRTESPPQAPLPLAAITRQIVCQPNGIIGTVSQRVVLRPEVPTKVLIKLRSPASLTFQPGALVASSTTGEINAPIDNLDAIHAVRQKEEVLTCLRNTTPIDIFLDCGDRVSGLIFQIIQENEIRPVQEVLPVSILVEKDEPLNLASKPLMRSLSTHKRQYLIQNVDLTKVDMPFRRMYRDFVLTNHDVFSESKYDVGRAKRFRHKVDLKTQVPQFRAQFRLAPAHQTFLAKTVEDLLKANAVVPCRSPYNAPVFAVPKSSGQGLRLVQDLRQLNEASWEDRFSILDTRSCLNKMGSNKPTVFSTLDLSSGFWQLGLTRESQKATAFTLPFQSRQYMWAVCPMGLRGSPSSFSRLMGEVMGNIEGVTTYIDDALVATPCHKSHMMALEKVGVRLRQYNLKLNPGKCVIGRREVTFLGHNVCATGISPAIDKIQAIKTIPPPSSITQLYQVIGLFNFFRGLLPQFAKRMAPLHRLTRKDSPWTKGPLPREALFAFQSMKESLCKGPVLRYPDFNRPFVLFVDAAGGASLSQTDKGGIGALLAQTDSKGHFAPVAYFSRALKGAERKYSAFELEYLALTDSLKYFQEYISGKKTICYTDHKPLQDASRSAASKTSQRLTELTQQFDIEIRYRAGKENGAADALSRNPRPNAVSIIDPKLLPAPPKSCPNLPDLQAKDSFISLVKAAKQGRGKAPTEDAHSLWLLAKNVAPMVFTADNMWWIAGSKNLSDTKVRLLAPKTKVQEILTAAHASPLAGHWARDRTLHHILQGWWWPTMAQDTSDFISKCEECQRAKGSMAKNMHTLNPWPTPKRFNERVHVDLVGPLLSAVGSGRYILAAVDSFTRWTMLQVIPCKTAQATRDAFFRGWICVWSAPEILVSDNGKEFENSLWQELAKAIGSRVHYIAPYHPASNGMVERFNEELKSYMSALVRSDTRDWENLVPTLMLAKNCSWNRHIQMSPFQALTATFPNVPWSGKKLIDGQQANQHPTLKDIFQMRKNLVESDQEAKEAFKKYHDSKHKKDVSYGNGDSVLVHHAVVPENVNKKFMRPWKGPAMVVSHLGNGVYEVQESHRPDGTLSRVHRDRLKPFKGSGKKVQERATLQNQTERPKERQVVHNTAMYLWAEAAQGQNQTGAEVPEVMPVIPVPPEVMPVIPVPPEVMPAVTADARTADADAGRANEVAEATSASPADSNSSEEFVTPTVLGDNLQPRIAASASDTPVSAFPNRQEAGRGAVAAHPAHIISKGVTNLLTRFTAVNPDTPSTSFSDIRNTQPTQTKHPTPPTRNQPQRVAKRSGQFDRSGKFHKQ